MKALGYFEPNNLESFALKEHEVGESELRPTDVLVRIHAISVNPVDYKVRQSRKAAGGRPVILGWDASGIVERVGSETAGFKPGDAVYYAGDLTRDGSYAELQAVDYRLVAPKPSNVTFAAAAALPLTSLTAWEALFERGFKFTDKTAVLVIGGAGGVGSSAIQLLKAKTGARVIATASRPETVEWVRKMGADEVIDHRRPLGEQLRNIGFPLVDIIFGTTHTESYLKTIPELLRPFGSLCLIDDPEVLDIAAFKSRALSVHWEFMFAKSMFSYELASQGDILRQVAGLVEQGRLVPAINTVLKGFTAENLRRAHQGLEEAKSIGKTVIEFS
jgi:NADPH:quinone reductase